MTEVVRAVLGALSATEVKHVYACCFQDNLHSKRLIERCGFLLEREGTFFSESLGKTFSSFEYRYDIP